MKNNSDSIRAGIKALGLCAISSILLASSANAAEEPPQPDPKVFEAIGMMFAQGSGLSRMGVFGQGNRIDYFRNC